MFRMLCSWVANAVLIMHFCGFIVACNDTSAPSGNHGIGGYSANGGANNGQGGNSVTLGGSANSTGGSGTQATEVVSSSCQVTVATGQPALIDDFDDGDNLSLANDGRLGSWWTVNDGTGTQVPSAVIGGTCNPVDSLNHKFQPTNGQACSSGDGFTGWGAQILLNLIDGHNGCISCPYVVTVFQGVRFKIGGVTSTTMHFEVGTAETATPDFGGTCAAGTACWNDFGKEIPLSSTMQVVSVRFDELAQNPTWGLRVNWDPRHAMYLRWTMPGGTTAAPLQFNFCLDDVEFF